LPAPVRAALVQAEEPEAAWRNILVTASLAGSVKKIYDMLDTEHPRHIDDIVESSALNSCDVLATLFELEMKNVVRQLPGKQFTKILL
jgi:predicted Rossmann fold nucleotide-binding protein DprA/Smf involved in DNA uptake